MRTGSCVCVCVDCQVGGSLTGEGLSAGRKTAMEQKETLVCICLFTAFVSVFASLLSLSPTFLLCLEHPIVSNCHLLSLSSASIKWP